MVADVASWFGTRVSALAIPWLVLTTTGSVERLASTLGAALGGALIALIGAPEALGVTAGCFAVSGLLVGLVVAPGLAGVVRIHDGTTRYLADLLEGLHFLRREPVLVGITVMVGLSNALDQAWAAVLVPAWVLHLGEGPRVVGMIFMAMTGAAVGGAMLAAIWAARLPRLTVYVVGHLVAGAPRYIAMALDLPLWAVLATLVVAGLGSGFLNPTLWLVGVCYFAVTMLPIVVPTWRGFGHRPTPTEPWRQPPGSCCPLFNVRGLCRPLVQRRVGCLGRARGPCRGGVGRVGAARPVSEQRGACQTIWLFLRFFLAWRS